MVLFASLGLYLVLKVVGLRLEGVLEESECFCALAVDHLAPGVRSRRVPSCFALSSKKFQQFLTTFVFLITLKEYNLCRISIKFLF